MQFEITKPLKTNPVSGYKLLFDVLSYYNKFRIPFPPNTLSFFKAKSATELRIRAQMKTNIQISLIFEPVSPINLSLTLPFAN